jgi:hypothetical protein
MLTTVTQHANGAITALNDNTLSGESWGVRDISGDASHAQGRWVQGTATTSAGAQTLDPGSGDAYHYLVFNALDAFPTTGSVACTAGQFTAPTYAGGSVVSPSALSGTASGSASMVFGPDGAAVTGSYDVTAGSGTGSGSINTTVSAPASAVFTGGILAGSSGAGVAVGDGGNGTYLIALLYTIQLSNGSKYQGVASFKCSEAA